MTQTTIRGSSRGGSGSIKGHVRVTTDQIDLVAQAVGKHRAKAFMCQRNPRSSHGVPKVEHADADAVSRVRFKPNQGTHPDFLDFQQAKSSRR